MTSHGYDYERIVQPIQEAAKKKGESSTFLDSDLFEPFLDACGNNLELCEEELTLEEVEEDYLIEIEIPLLSENLEEEFGEDDLIEIDISMGSIRS